MLLFPASSQRWLFSLNGVTRSSLNNLNALFSPSRARRTSQCESEHIVLNTFSLSLAGNYLIIWSSISRAIFKFLCWIYSFPALSLSLSPFSLSLFLSLPHCICVCLVGRWSLQLQVLANVKASLRERVESPETTGSYRLMQSLTPPNYPDENRPIDHINFILRNYPQGRSAAAKQ